MYSWEYILSTGICFIFTCVSLVTVIPVMMGYVIHFLTCNNAKKNFQFAPDFLVFFFFTAGGFGKNVDFFKARPKLKVVGGCFWAHMLFYYVFFEKF